MTTHCTFRVQSSISLSMVYQNVDRTEDMLSVLVGLVENGTSLNSLELLVITSILESTVTQAATNDTVSLIQM